MAALGASRIVLALGPPLALLAYSHDAIFGRLAEAGPTTVAAGRFAVAAMALWPLALVRHAGALRGLRRADLGWTLLAGSLLALDFGFWIAATQLTSIASSLILANLAPVWVLLLAACRLRRRPCRRDLQIVTLSVVGAAIVTGGGFAAFAAGGADLGNLLAATSSIPAAAFLVVSASVHQRLPTPVYLVLTWSWATALLLMVDLAAGAAWPTGHEALLAILAMGILAQLLGHGLLTWSLRWLSPCYVAVCCLAEPVLGGLLGVLYFQDRIDTHVLAGGLLILLAIYLGARVERPGPT